MQQIVNSYVTKPAEETAIFVEEGNEKTVHNGHGYNSGYKELPTIEHVVEKILQQEKSEYEESTRQADPWEVQFLQKSEAAWEKQKQLYLRIEKFVRENNDKLPSWPVAGPLNYGMSLDEMKDVITKKFKEMVSSGNLMTQESLNVNHARETFYPPVGKGNNNLTRIWGAEFLKSNLLPETKLNAAEHFLIVDDSASEIEVQVWLTEYPYLSIVNNAHVLSRKIEGARKASEYRFSSELSKVGYKDFADPGNILRDLEGIGWVVDTEAKSFDPPKLSNSQHVVNTYLKKRFELLSQDGLFHTFKIAIEDLGRFKH